MDSSASSSFVRFDLPTLPLDDWNTLVNQMLDSRQEAVKKNERKYIYLNYQENEIALGYKKGVPTGFKKLAPKEIVDIFFNKLPKHLNEHQVNETQQNIDRIFQIKETKILPGKLFSIFSSSSFESKALVELAINHRAVLGKLEKILPETNHIIRSTAGKTGIYFLHHEAYEEPPLALKLMSNPITHVIADRFYKKLNFLTPLYTAFPRESELGELAVQKLKDLGIDNLKEKQETTNDRQEKEALERKIAQLEYQLQDTQHIMVMTYVPGITFAELHLDDLIETLLQEKVLLDIGEMIFLDVLLHNTDRMHPERSNNLDNLLLNPNASNEERGIALIDHDFKVNRRNWKTIATSLMKLAKGELTEQIIKNLKTSVNIRLSNDPVAAETYQEQLNQQGKNIKKCLEQGFHRGAQNLLQACREPGVLSSLLEVSSSSNLSFPKEEFSDRVQIFTELLKIVKKHYS
ncbi:hypothetical protein NEOC84_001427|uniref:hypothetical protein n=1 Tax=Neochlamydia sp. AcF84 TaxID=2315858 RepID=UPI00140CF0B5|nr:hypothetical protein [Neochlamydia sp. AcF84]NGY95506.1 hypothetical protein [Neochlamydia sp. AcF84]